MMWKVFTQKSDMYTHEKFYDTFSVLFYYDTGAVFEKKKIFQTDNWRKKKEVLSVKK